MSLCDSCFFKEALIKCVCALAKELIIVSLIVTKKGL